VTISFFSGNQINGKQEKDERRHDPNGVDHFIEAGIIQNPLLFSVSDWMIPGRIVFPIYPFPSPFSSC
jgi:hypothetical protein